MEIIFGRSAKAWSEPASDLDRWNELSLWGVDGTAPAGTMKTELSMLREMLAVLVLPERRPERRYERHVKIKMSGYKRNPGRAAKSPT